MDATSEEESKVDQGAEDLVELVRRQLCDTKTSWAVGTFGANAEFHRDAANRLRCLLPAR